MRGLKQQLKIIKKKFLFKDKLEFNEKSKRFANPLYKRFAVSETTQKYLML